MGVLKIIPSKSQNLDLPPYRLLIDITHRRYMSVRKCHIAVLAMDVPIVRAAGTVTGSIRKPSHVMGGRVPLNEYGSFGGV
jgi:hypothetical protein